MAIKDYIRKLQQKPVRERERIAVVWTAIGFAIILVIWVVSFREIFKSTEMSVEQNPATLRDLKVNFQEGKKSIQDMIRNLPNQTETVNGDNINSNLNNNDNNLNAGSAAANVSNDNDIKQNDQNNTAVPQLP